jgi:Sporulation initiation factor Spo0A C terminal.
MTQKLGITNILFSIGIPPLITGYPYIIAAILMLKNKLVCVETINEAYSEIAFQYNTSPARVERAIRHAIQISWDWEGEKSLKCFYSDVQTTPSNIEFFDFLNSCVL